MNRRKFAVSALGLSALSSVNSGFVSVLKENMTSDKSGTTQTVEWNVHFFSSDTQKYPFHPQATYTPDVSRLSKDPLKEYLDQLDSRGIGKGVVVQPEPYGDDHSLLVDCLKRSPDRLRGTSLFYPKDPEAPKKLEYLVKQHPGIVVTRFHAHRGKENYLDTFADPGVRALWKKAAELDIVIELHIGPNYALQVKETIEAFPGSKVLIDHFAEPHLGDAVEFANVLELASFPTVYMKFSGLAHFADDEPDFLSALPFTKQVLNAFGPDQMIMGGLSLETVEKHMTNYSKDEIARVTGKNILKLLKWV